MLILDEPTTALDVTVQFEILKLIKSLRDDLGMGIVLVTHDLGVVEFLCDRIMTMYAGATVEIAATADVKSRPVTRTPARSWSRGSASATSSGPLLTIPGESPSVGSWPSGCRFNPRCPHRTDACTVGDQPALRTVGASSTACILAEEVT